MDEDPWIRQKAAEEDGALVAAKENPPFRTASRPRRFLCLIGWHRWMPVWDKRPETRSNMLGLGVLACRYCDALKPQ